MLLYDPDRDAVVLIEQFRPGAFTAGHSTPWLIEVVAGIVEDGENAELAIRRKALEEAGCANVDIMPIVEIFPSPGGSSEIVSVYCGRIDAHDAGGDVLRHERDGDEGALVALRRDHRRVPPRSGAPTPG